MSTGLKDEGRVSAWTPATVLHLPCGASARPAPSHPRLPPQAYRVEVGALVLGAVTGIAEGLLTAWVLAQIRLLARVAPQVYLEVLQP